MGKRVLVCGGRDYEDVDVVWAALDPLFPSVVIHGGAHGADDIAGRWAAECGVPCMVFSAPWGHGPKAGPILNSWMLKYGQPDLVLAFPGGRGTEDMVRQAEMAGVEVRRVT